MATTIVLKNSVTTTNTPSSLAQGEVAINVTDKKVWVGNAATTPVLLITGGTDCVFNSVTDSGLTNTRVTYAGTGGLLKDSASITTDGTTITAGGFSGPHNGTVGATTPSTGAFTTLTATNFNTASTFGFKNRLINGAMVIDQRNAGASVTPSPGNYVVDRWYWQASQSPKVTIQQNQGSVTPPVGFSNYLGVTSSSAYSITSTDYFWISQKIEGFNVADLGWGTANAKTVTVSFQVYSSLTGTFGGCVQNPAQTRSYPISYSIPTANTWTSISITIPGDTSGTWVGATNAAAINLVFSLGMGSAYSGTANAWASAAYESSTGAVSVVGTNGATWYVTGVQLETGSVATTFDYRDYATELVRCQRYYEKDTEGAGLWSGNFTNGSTYYYMYYYKVTKRTSATPTITTAASGLNTPTVQLSALNGFRIISTGASDGSGGYFLASTWNVSSEL